MSLRNLLAVLILLSVAVLAVTLYLNLSVKEAKEILEALPKEIDLALEKVHYTQTEEGRRSWTLDADSAAYRREAGVVELQGVSMTFYSVGSYAEVKMTAREGRFDQQHGQVEAWGDVQIVTDRDEHFFTERLHYDEQTRLVSSDTRVRMTSPSLVLEGSGFRLERDTGRMSLLQDVKARIMTVAKERTAQ